MRLSLGHEFVDELVPLGIVEPLDVIDQAGGFAPRAEGRGVGPALAQPAELAEQEPADLAADLAVLGADQAAEDAAGLRTGLVEEAVLRRAQQPPPFVGVVPRPALAGLDVAPHHSQKKSQLERS